jgi:thioredoxin reductase
MIKRLLKKTEIAFGFLIISRSALGVKGNSGARPADHRIRGDPLIYNRSYLIILHLSLCWLTSSPITTFLAQPTPHTIMSLQQIGIYLDFVKLIASFVARLVVQKAQSIVHRFTYRPSSDPLNVIVVGGSFAGCLAAQRLAHTLPTGYRVILVEKHSHFHYTFSFPRNAVFSGREHHAFIAYDGLAAGAPEGIFHQICDEVTEVGEKNITTSGGVSLDYDYLVVATGASQPPPARLRASRKDNAIAELQELQQRIEKAHRIAVVGGGAVGVELATEIKDKYPHKQITLIHSRKQLLPRFGPKLHEHVLAKLREQAIEVLLGEKPTLSDDAGQIVRETNLTFTNGETKTFDLVVSRMLSDTIRMLSWRLMPLP